MMPARRCLVSEVDNHEVLSHQEGSKPVAELWASMDVESVTLLQVFKPMRTRARRFERPWSIAELRLSEEDVTWLRRWFQGLSEKSVRDWMHPELEPEVGADQGTREQQMFGALLTCAVAETCRREGTEASVWPMVRNILPLSADLRRHLFLRDGQPSQLTRQAIAGAAQDLGLRNVLDIEGTQQWFLTIKLQFGFTFRGAKRNLSKWLVNLGQPHAVCYLLGEGAVQQLGSESFSSLWRALKQYRRSLIGAREVKDVLLESPWILPGWIDDLLKEAKARIAALGTGEGIATPVSVHEEEAIEEKTCPISAISLDWPHTRAPRLVLQLNKTSIVEVLDLCEVTEADLVVDGSRIARWLQQGDGSWIGPDRIYAEPDRQANQPNLSPRVLSIESRSGEVLLEWELADSGILEEVLLFDMQRGRLPEAGFTALDPNRTYVILCDTSCEVERCTPAEVFETSGASRKAIRVEPPIDDGMRISFGDFVLWQPIAHKASRPEMPPLVLTTCPEEVLSLHDRAFLRLQGLPKDAKDVQLLIHKTTYDMVLVDNEWRTNGKVTIMPELAARQRRTWARFSSAGARYCVRPHLALKMIGAAMLSHAGESDGQEIHFEVLKPGSQLSCAEGTGYIRLWVPEKEEPSCAYEGGYRIGTVRHSKVRLHDVPGHGGELCVSSSSAIHSLGVTCVNAGCVRRYAEPMLGCDAQLLLTKNKELDPIGPDGYMIYEWECTGKGRTKLTALPERNITPLSGKLLRLQGSSTPMAIALAWQGVRVGAWWDLRRIADYLETKRVLSDRDFALLKWLRVPILHPSVASGARTAIRTSPRRFIETWTGTLGLPPELNSSGYVEGVDSLIRNFLWADVPLSQGSSLIEWAWLPETGRATPSNVLGWARTLDRLSDVSPLLLRKAIQGLSKCDAEATEEVLHVFVRRRLELPLDVSGARIGSQLARIKESLACFSALSLERVDMLIGAQITAMHRDEWETPEGLRDDLLRVGQTRAGRQYLAAITGLYSSRRGRDLLVSRPVSA